MINSQVAQHARESDQTLSHKKYNFNSLVIFLLKITVILTICGFTLRIILKNDS
jgi:hypothetical protein